MPTEAKQTGRETFHISGTGQEKPSLFPTINFSEKEKEDKDKRLKKKAQFAWKMAQSAQEEVLPDEVQRMVSTDLSRKGFSAAAIKKILANPSATAEKFFDYVSENPQNAQLQRYAKSLENATLVSPQDTARGFGLSLANAAALTPVSPIRRMGRIARFLHGAYANTKPVIPELANDMYSKITGNPLDTAPRARSNEADIYGQTALREARMQDIAQGFGSDEEKSQAMQRELAQPVKPSTYSEDARPGAARAVEGASSKGLDLLFPGVSGVSGAVGSGLEAYYRPGNASDAEVRQKAEELAKIYETSPEEQMDVARERLRPNFGNRLFSTDTAKSLGDTALKVAPSVFATAPGATARYEQRLIQEAMKPQGVLGKAYSGVRNVLGAPARAVEQNAAKGVLGRLIGAQSSAARNAAALEAAGARAAGGGLRALGGRALGALGRSAGGLGLGTLVEGGVRGAWDLGSYMNLNDNPEQAARWEDIQNRAGDVAAGGNVGIGNRVGAFGNYLFGDRDSAIATLTAGKLQDASKGGLDSALLWGSGADSEGVAAGLQHQRQQAQRPQNKEQLSSRIKSEILRAHPEYSQNLGVLDEFAGDMAHRIDLAQTVGQSVGKPQPVGWSQTYKPHMNLLPSSTWRQIASGTAGYFKQPSEVRAENMANRRAGLAPANTAIASNKPPTTIGQP